MKHFYRPQTKFGASHNFRSVCQEFCPQGWYPSMPCRWYPSMSCRYPWGGIPACLPLGVSRPTPRGKLRGLARGFSRPTPGGGLQTHTCLGVSRPTPRGDCVSQHALRQTSPLMDSYCHGWYASYWNAFLSLT